MGAPIGTLKDGYLVIRLEKKSFRLHRLAWLWVYGRLPSGDLDHKNGDRSDNRISNLREATRVQNTYNRGANPKNPSGIKGVCWHPAANKWMARARVGGVPHYLGVYSSKEEAGRVVREFQKTHHGKFYKQH